MYGEREREREHEKENPGWEEIEKEEERVHTFHNPITLYKLQTPHLLLDNQEEAFRMLSHGDVSICPIQTLGQVPLQPLLAGPGFCVGYIETLV